MNRRVLLLVAAISLLHASFFIVYQIPDRDVAWTDQGGYRRLGAVFAETGQFTRYPDYPTFVPEVIRTPGYPAFVAAVYLVAGRGNDTAVAIAQAFVFTGICLIAFAIGCRVAGDRVGGVAAIGTSLFAPIPYFGALVVTEVWTTFVASLAMLACIRAVQRQRTREFVLAGVLFSATTLVRPAFVLLPFFLAIGVPLLVRAQRKRPELLRWSALALAATLTLLPWFTYNYMHLGRVTLSPAGGIGRGLWEGSWQGKWPGRLQAELTAVAGEPIPRDELDRRVRQIADRSGLAPEPMLNYVRQWRDIRAIWETPVDPLERSRSRVAADQEYLRVAIENIAQDPLGHVWRRLTLGTFVLWAAEVPIRYTDINGTPTIVIRGIWLVQVGLVLAAIAGVVVLLRRGCRLEAMLLALPLVYVTGVHLPLLCEARQSLPVKPLVIVLAATAVSPLIYPRTAGS